MEQLEFLQLAATELESLGIPWMLVGSYATSAFGEARFTQDIDIVVDLQPEHVHPLCGAFSGEEFYVSEAAATEAIRSLKQFKVSIQNLETRSTSCFRDVMNGVATKSIGAKRWSSTRVFTFGSPVPKTSSSAKCVTIRKAVQTSICGTPRVSWLFKATASIAATLNTGLNTSGS